MVMSRRLSVVVAGYIFFGGWWVEGNVPIKIKKFGNYFGGGEEGGRRTVHP